MTREEEIRARCEVLLDECARLRATVKGTNDAARVISDDKAHLRKENARLRAELEAAKDDLERAADCDTCAYGPSKKLNCLHRRKLTNEVGCYEWRGPCAENGGTK